MENILTSYSWVMIVRGIVAILFGVLALFWPAITLELLIFLFAAYALVDGAIALFSSVGAAKKHEKWWIFLAEGIFGIALGIVVLAWPAITVIILIYLIATWAFITGLIELMASFALPWEKAPRWLLGFAGVLSLILGVLMFVYPIGSVAILILFLGIFALLFGVSLIILGIKIYKEARV